MKSTRLALVHGPTPILHLPALDALVGAEVWVKRDDATGGAESGNKLRKLEFLLADARAKDTKVVLTCGALQSNHARATALVAARLGMRSILFLRTDDPEAPSCRGRATCSSTGSSARRSGSSRRRSTAIERR